MLRLTSLLFILVVSTAVFAEEAWVLRLRIVQDDGIAPEHLRVLEDLCHAAQCPEQRVRELRYDPSNLTLFLVVDPPMIPIDQEDISSSELAHKLVKVIQDTTSGVESVDLEQVQVIWCPMLGGWSTPNSKSCVSLPKDEDSEVDSEWAEYSFVAIALLALCSFVAMGFMMRYAHQRSKYRLLHHEGVEMQSA